MSKEKLIYIADDEKNIRNLLTSFLKKEGYQVRAFATGDQLYTHFLQQESDLVILDVMMPGTDGLTICHQIRQISHVPIIILTARDGEGDFVAGITLGSDDYFVKPFSPVMLVMRVKAIFRRIAMDKADRQRCLEFSNVSVWPDKKEVLIDGQILPLTMTEYELFHYLMANQERAVSREELLNKVWGYDAEVETRVTDDTVKRLRKKLTAGGSQMIISTLWGYGFKLERGGETSDLS